MLNSDMTRRNVIRGAAGLGGVAAGTSVARGDDSVEEVLFHETFDGPDGSWPSEWTPIGNRNQEIVHNGGQQVYQMSGEPGGCWQALADKDIPIPEDGAIRLSMRVLPTDDGRTGCHDHRTTVSLRTATGTWDAGSSVRLLRLYPGGFASGPVAEGRGGVELGEYSVGEWNDITVTYEREGDDVTQRYWIDGDHRETITREVSDHEDDLSYLRIGSGDFTVLWDEVLIERIDPASATETSTSGIPPSSVWELMRTMIGAGITVIVFLLIPGALLSGDDDTSTTTPRQKPSKPSQSGTMPKRRNNSSNDRVPPPDDSPPDVPETDKYGQFKK